MTILQVHKYYYPRDGASKATLDVTRLLEARGHTVIPFATQNERNLPSPYSKYFVSYMDLNAPERVSFFNKFRFAARLLYNREAKRNMEALLSDHHVDIVHVHNIYHHISPSILGVIKKRGIPIVMTLHDYKLICPNYTMFHHGAAHEEDANGWYLSCVKNKCMKNSFAQSAIVTAEMIYHHKIMRYYERFVDHFISPSQFLIEMCVRYGWPREKFTCIPNAVALDKEQGTRNKEQGTIDENSKTLNSELRTQNSAGRGYVAYIGRLSEEKGIEVLLKAAEMTPEIPYVIAGVGSLLEKIRNPKSEIKNITCVGFQTEDLARTYDEASITVVPSVWYENNPLSILEAKAAGKVVLASNIGGIPEMLPKELLVPAGDAAALAQKIRHWYQASADERAVVGKHMQAEVARDNDPQEYVKKVEAIYIECAK